MAKLQSISWAAILIILGGTNIVAHASTVDNQPAPFQVAQKNSDDEMLDALQQRDKKVREGLDKVRKLTGTESKKNEPKSEEDLSPEEMIEAIENRQEKIEQLKELKQLENLNRDRETLEILQADNFEIESLEELEIVRNVINNPDLNEEEMLGILQGQDINIENLKQLKQLKKKVAQKSYSSPESGMSAEMAFKMLAVGLPAVILLFLIGKPIVQGIVDVIVSNYQEKFGKPKVPERSLNMHHHAFTTTQRLGKKAESLDNAKFSSDEFKLLIGIKVKAIKGIEGYKELSYRSELLRAAILAQKSFLKLEATELRYRSRKQQQFYQYVADNLEEDLDKDEFIQKVKLKQEEILPQITTDEGKTAINSYARDIEELGKHELGLKLLALFKKFELTDFSIIRDVSNIVEGLAGHDLVDSKSLILTVKEYYDVFHKLSPILDIVQDEQSATTYARILQVVALMHRHEDSYNKFKNLINLLRKWEKPYETATMIRKQYDRKEYAIPSEFTQELLGTHTYQKYAEYIANL